MLPRLHKLRPVSVVLTVGADCLYGDPLSAMALSNGALWRAVSNCVAEASCAVVLGGGGYNPWVTARAWAGLWATLSDAAIPSVLPPAAVTLLKALTCDLVEPEEFAQTWFKTLLDAPNTGPIRPRIREITDYFK